MDSIIRVDNSIVETENTDTRIVDVNLSKVDKAKAAAVLSEVVECFAINKGKMPPIESEKRYYLDLTKEMKEKLSTGECWFTEKSATGNAMGQLRHRVDGRSEIYANPDIVAEDVPTQLSSCEKSLSNSIQQIALQQQMAELSKQLDKIQSAVNRIEIGQMDDRFAKIDAAEKTLRLAYVAEDLNNRNALINQAIPLLQEGSESIKRVIVRRINEFEPIPSKDWQIKAKMWLSPTNYIDKVNQQFDNIQTCFDYYDKAQKLAAMAFMMIDELKAMEEVLFQEEKFIKTLNIAKLKTMQNLHYNIDFSGEWFYSPQAYLDEKRIQYLDFYNEKYNHLLIEATGKQILEVLENDQTGRPGQITEEEQVCEEE